MKKKYFNYLFFILLLLFLITPNVFAIDYNNICGEERVQRASIIIGYVVLIMKIIVPLIIIVLGMVDFGKATLSDDEKAISKATTSLIRRFIAGLVVFFLPSIILVFLDLIGITNGLEKENGSFGACTTCILNVSKCD